MGNWIKYRTRGGQRRIAYLTWADGERRHGLDLAGLRRLGLRAWRGSGSGEGLLIRSRNRGRRLSVQDVRVWRWLVEEVRTGPLDMATSLMCLPRHPWRRCYRGGWRTRRRRAPHGNS